MATKSLYKIRNSDIHGYGAFAKKRIRKGTQIIEYIGERISYAEADRRIERDKSVNSFVLQFTVDDKMVIDAAVGGNDARFVNHSCDPNCEAVNVAGQIYIEALRTIEPGEELDYDYGLEGKDGEDDNWEEQYVCRCGSKNCTGTMLKT